MERIIDTSNMEFTDDAPIVRCCDCVCWGNEPNKSGCATCYELSEPEDGMYRLTRPDDFCIWGDRGE